MEGMCWKVDTMFDGEKERVMVKLRDMESDYGWPSSCLVESFEMCFYELHVETSDSLIDDEDAVEFGFVWLSDNRVGFGSGWMSL